jgi:hypothetical protein
VVEGLPDDAVVPDLVLRRGRALQLGLPRQRVGALVHAVRERGEPEAIEGPASEVAGGGGRGGRDE